MRFRLISKHADGIALLYRIWKEGNECDFWVQDKAAKPSYTGMLKQVGDWKIGLTKDTIIIFDMVGLGPTADKLRKQGYKVYGGGGLNDRLELDRSFGINVAKISGLKIPKFKKFDSFDEAKGFVKGSGKSWVFKPQDNKSPAFTYVSTDEEDMIEMLDHFKGLGKLKFILQEKIDGQEMSVEQFYSEGKPVAGTLNSTLEQKKFMDGDKGENTGCQSSLVRFWKHKDPKIYRLSLKKAEPFIRRFKFHSPLDVNCIISDKDGLPYFLEFTARFGYSALYALLEGLNIETGKFISDLASGIDPKISPDYSWLGSVRVSIPPYPHDGAEKSANKPVRGLRNTEHIWLLDVKHDNGKLLTAGVDGVICEVTGKAPTLAALGKEIYGRIAGLKIPDMQYRSDVIEQGIKRIKLLEKLKYI